jgi:hypothetical protein
MAWYLVKLRDSFTYLYVTDAEDEVIYMLILHFRLTLVLLHTEVVCKLRLFCCSMQLSRVLSALLLPNQLLHQPLSQLSFCIYES